MLGTGVVAVVGAAGLFGAPARPPATLATHAAHTAPGAAVRTVTAGPDVATLPVVVADRVIDAVVERPVPRTPGSDALLIGGMAALAALLAGLAAAEGSRRRPTGTPLGAGSTRAPPAVC